VKYSIICNQEALIEIERKHTVLVVMRYHTKPTCLAKKANQKGEEMSLSLVEAKRFKSLNILAAYARASSS